MEIDIVPGANVMRGICRHNGRVKFDKLAQAGIVGIIQKVPKGSRVLIQRTSPTKKSPR